MESICHRLRQSSLVIMPYKIFLWGFYIASYLSTWKGLFVCLEFLFVWVSFFPNRQIWMVLQGYDRLGLEKYRSADAELCRTVTSKGYLLLDSCRAASICSASLLLLPGLKRPHRKWRGFVCLRSLNIVIPYMICLMSMAPQWSEANCPACTLNVFCLGKKRESHQRWQCIQF